MGERQSEDSNTRHRSGNSHFSSQVRLLPGDRTNSLSGQGEMEGSHSQEFAHLLTCSL